MLCSTLFNASACSWWKVYSTTLCTERFTRYPAVIGCTSFITNFVAGRVYCPARPVPCPWPNSPWPTCYPFPLEPGLPDVPSGVPCQRQRWWPFPICTFTRRRCKNSCPSYCRGGWCRRLIICNITPPSKQRMEHRWCRAIGFWHGCGGNQSNHPFRCPPNCYFRRQNGFPIHPHCPREMKIQLIRIQKTQQFRRLPQLARKNGIEVMVTLELSPICYEKWN
mmetsp:Transcript_22492/g.48990  ORF Transcript_22492/g.48990 Transcript_22492/m.48990 type:complete len:222 (+) Transcript_22492:581-1246(+)